MTLPDTLLAAIRRYTLAQHRHREAEAAFVATRDALTEAAVELGSARLATHREWALVAADVAEQDATPKETT